MSKLAIIANIKAKREHTDFVRKELIKLVSPTLKEDGCIKYELHQDQQESSHFLFYQIWDSNEHWQDHMNNEHIKEYLISTNGMIEEFYVQEMDILSELF